MNRLRIQSLLLEDLPAWSRCESNPTRRKSCLNELKGLFQSGASEPGLLWWAREEEGVLARLLLVRDEGGLAAGQLELPWQGAWRGLLRRLLGRVLVILERQGATSLEIGEEALAGQRLSLPELGRELEALGFRPSPPRALARLRRTRTATRGPQANLPAGAELDGDDGAIWRLAGLPGREELGGELGSLAAFGVLRLRLEWTGRADELADRLPADWVAEACWARQAWRRPLGGGDGAQ